MTTSFARADLHVHPAGDQHLRDDSEAFLPAIARSGLAIVALTDHDRIDLARDLVVQAQDLDITVELIIGSEITTRDGHLIGLWLSTAIPAGLSLADSVAAVHDQGGVAIVAHPLLPTVISAPGRLLAELAQGSERNRPDALEVFNPMAAWLPLEARYVRRFARRHGYALVGGSDGHRAQDVGRGFTQFAGTTAPDLRAAIADHAAEGDGRGYGWRDAAAGVLAQMRDGLIRPGR